MDGGGQRHLGPRTSRVAIRSGLQPSHALNHSHPRLPRQQRSAEVDRELPWSTEVSSPGRAVPARKVAPGARNTPTARIEHGATVPRR